MAVDRLELFEKRHDHELEVRERITSRLHHSLSVLIVLVGIALYLLREVRGDARGNALAWFGLFLLLATIACVAMAHFIIRGLWGPSYHEAHTADTLAAQLDKITATYEQYDADNGTKAVEEEAAKYLRDMFRECATANAQQNDYRATLTHNANGAAIWAVIFLALGFLVLKFGALEKDGSASVELTKPVSVDVLSLPSQGAAPLPQ
jgi:hypothetical protein